MSDLYQGQGRAPEALRFTGPTRCTRMEVGEDNNGFRHQAAQNGNMVYQYQLSPIVIAILLQEFGDSLHKALGTQLDLSTVYHPRAPDGQSERTI
ncbi:hypothetical protein Tco_0918481 [Tanacetum coccineum]